MRLFQKKIRRALRILRSYNINCKVTSEEFLRYVTAPTLTGDTTKLEDILENDFLMIHEIIEICKFKELGISIDRNIFLRNPDLAYELHLEAMKIELDYARRKNDLEWIRKRVNDLESYLDDPNLPASLRKICLKIIKDYMEILSESRKS